MDNESTSSQNHPTLVEMLDEMIAGMEEAIDEMEDMRDFAINNNLPKAMDEQLCASYRDSYYSVKSVRMRKKQ